MAGAAIGVVALGLAAPLLGLSSSVAHESLLSSLALGFLRGAEQIEGLYRISSWPLWTCLCAVSWLLFYGLFRQLSTRPKARAAVGWALLVGSITVTSPAWLLHRSGLAGLVAAVAAGALSFRGTRDPSDQDELRVSTSGHSSLAVATCAAVLLLSIQVGVVAILGLSWTVPGLVPGPMAVRSVLSRGSSMAPFLAVFGAVSGSLLLLARHHGSTGFGLKSATLRVLGASTLGISTAYLLSFWFGEAGPGVSQIGFIIFGASLGSVITVEGRRRSGPYDSIVVWAIVLVLFPWGLSWDHLWACDQVELQPGVQRLSERSDGFDIAHDPHSNHLLVAHRDQRLLAVIDLDASLPTTPALIDIELVAGRLDPSVPGIPAMLAPENVLSLGDGTFLAYAFLYRSEHQWTQERPFHESREILVGNRYGPPGPSGVLLLRISSADGSLLEVSPWRGCWPAGLSLHRSAGLVVTTCEESSQFWLAPLLSPEAAYPVELPEDLRIERLLPLGSADNPRAWAVPLWEGEQLVELNLLTGELLATQALGGFNWDIAGSEASGRAFVPRFVSAATLQINMRTRAIEDTLELDVGMRAVEYDPKAEIVYAASTYSGRLGAWFTTGPRAGERIAPPLRLGTMLRTIELDSLTETLYAASDCGVFEVDLRAWDSSSYHRNL